MTPVGTRADRGGADFLGDDYLLDSAPARRLFEAVRELPIVDAHNHADIVEIADDRPWTDIWHAEGATDHYVWELMRRTGVDEERITGSAPNREKWRALAAVFPRLAGNPTYEWVHLDLRRRLGIDEVISASTADAIWDAAHARLLTPELRPRAVLRALRVEAMCTTDDPTVRLPHHERARREIAHTVIVPTWRPDKAMFVERDTWRPAIDRLGAETGSDTATLTGLLEALATTHDRFAELGCVASDHGVLAPCSHPVSRERASAIHAKAHDGEPLRPDEAADYHAFMLVRFAEMDEARGWVMQLHLGAVRDYRDSLFAALGRDCGGDISDHRVEIVNGLRHLLNRFDGRLKLVLYCLDPGHLATLATIARAFPNVSVGVPWWFNDSPHGMESHLRYLATVDLLWRSAGMVTDSRKLLSFGSRTEMWRRVLCNAVGDMVAHGRMPEAEALALVSHVAYEGPRRLFGGFGRAVVNGDAVASGR